MSAPAIGIDLGTTYSCVAVYRHGREEIIPNEEGNRITPSCVAFTNNERLIGDAAKNQEALNPTNTIFDAKRLIGRKFNDATVQNDIKVWPFQVINDNNKPKIKVNYKGASKIILPEEISAMVLTKMKEIAENYLGEEVQNAVITVPAYFDNAQRQATKDAGAIAGLNVLRIVNEPTAAALAYGLGTAHDDERNVLIFDLGGGTFDVTILTIEEGIFEVRATAGNTHLGGSDFDNRMVVHVLEEITKKYKKDLKDDKKAIRRLKTACERAKRVLSTSNQASISLELLIDGKDFNTTITRARFEELNIDMFKSTIDTVAKALKDAKMKIENINDVVLVGGSTRIPMVQSLLQDFFKGKQLNKSVNPDEAVAAGAAIQAALLEGDESEELQEIVLLDVTPLTLGINIVGDVMAPVVERNSSIPKKVSKNFTTTFDNQTSVLFEVFQGERLMNKENKLLGTFNLNGIPPAPRKVPKLDVTFEIDANGILNVSAVEAVTKRMNQIMITDDIGGIPKEEIERMVKDAERYKKEDQERKELAEAKNELEYYCFSLKTKIPQSKATRQQRELILSKCTDTINWMDSGPDVKKQEYIRRLQDLKIIGDPLIRNI